MIEHIGTIAKSGTREFLQALTGDQRKDATLIGQFGVGFYSAFIVAERVTLTTRRDGPARRARASGGSRTAGASTRWRRWSSPSRGTTVVLQLREGEDDLLNGYRLRSIIQKYSDHISLPIVMPSEPAKRRGRDRRRPRRRRSTRRRRCGPGPRASSLSRTTATSTGTSAGDFTDPLAWVHSKVEGTYEYTLLLFIPSRAPYDLWIPQAGPGRQAAHPAGLRAGGQRPAAAASTCGSSAA